ncbi:MAG: right-handed parallel beta-helix repeat-containing protein [Myxococcota bacterium]
MHRWLLPATLILFGCPPGEGQGKDDTGGDDTKTSYDEGCILVDGAGGYAHVNDAIAVASEGSTIELCDGTYEEAVVVDKAVTITGGQSSVIDAPSNEVALTITAAGATVENVGIESTRTGIFLDGATDTTLSGLAVGQTGGLAISSTDAVGTLVVDSTFDQPQGGGVEISGGSITLSSSAFTSPAGYAVHAKDGAEVTLEETTIEGTVMLSTDGSDGYAIYGEDAIVTVTGGSIAGADLVGLLTVGGSLTMTDVAVTDTLYGIYAADSTFTADGLTLSGNLVQGIYALHPTDAITVSNTTIEVDPDSACSDLYEDWTGICGGLLAVSPVVAFTTVTVSGYNNYGTYVGSYDGEEPAVATITDVLVSDVGRWGMRFDTAEGTVANATIYGLREPENADPCYGYVDQGDAMLLQYADLAIDGLTITESAAWGLSLVFGGATVTNSTIDGSACAGVINYQSVATITGSRFTNSSDLAGIFDYEGVTTVDSNTFETNHAWYYFEWEDTTTGVVYGYEYGGYGQDVYAYQSAGLTVTNNTFTDGDSSIYAYASPLVATGNTWTDYEGTILYTFYGDEGSPPLFSGNSVDDVGGTIAYVGYGALEIEDLDVGTTRPALVEYRNYEDGVLTSESSYSSYSYAFYAYGYDAESASISMEDVTIAETSYRVLYASDAAVDLKDVSVGLAGADLGVDAIYATWTYFPADFEAEGVTIGETGGDGIVLANGNTTDGYVWLEDVTVGTVSDDALSLQGLVSATIVNLQVEDAGGDAVSSTAAYSFYDYDTGAWNTVDFATALDVSGSTVTSAGGTGFALSGGSATLASTTVTSSGLYAIYAEGLTAITLQDVTAATPGRTGVVVDDRWTYTDAYGTGYSVDADTVALLERVTVTSSPESGIEVSGGTLTITGSSASGSTDDGLVLTDVTADVQANSFAGNAGYGMTCSTVTLAACATNDLTGNTLGTHDGCDDACGQ